MPEEKRVYSPSRGYDIQLKIKEFDYTNDLRSVRVVSAINAPYQIINLSISLDPNDIILEDIIGKEPLKLSIKLIGRGEEKTPLESVDFTLLYIKHTSNVIPKEQKSDQSFKDRVLVHLITVCSDPFKTMTYFVNDIFLEKTPKQIIEELVTNAGGTLEYDTDGENSEVIDQIVLPPTTLYNTIRYLDDNFGLFDGTSNLGFCQFDNKLYVQNLTTRMDKNQEFTIYQLATNDPKLPEIIEKSTDGKSFYTYFPIKDHYSGAAKFATLSKNLNYIVKPKDLLFRIIEQKLDQSCLDYGAIAKDPEIVTDPKLNDRKVYNIHHSGNDSSDVFSHAKVGREIIGLATLEIQLEKSLPILKLIKVGSPVKVKTRTMEYIPLSGKYLLKSSDLQFTRQSADWISIASIVVMRTNQYI